MSSQRFSYTLHSQFIEPFSPLRLAFAWIDKPSTEVRVLLGQVNFFQEFDVHFYGRDKAFEISRKL